MVRVPGWVGVVIFFIVLGIIILVAWALRYTSSTSCSPDKPCLPGLKCLNGKCVYLTACNSNADCGPNGICDNGTCVQCKTDNQCHLGSFCSNGRCSTIACTGGVCPAGLTCNTSTSVCFPHGCSVNSQCDAGYVCQSGYCTKYGNTCTGPVDCYNRTLICSSGYCQQCVTNSNCPSGMTCVVSPFGPNGPNLGICK